MKEPREFLAAQVYSNGVQCGVTAGFCLFPRPDNEVLASRANKSYHSEVGAALCDRATEVLRHTLPSGNNLVVDWPRRPDPDPCNETCHPSLLVWPLAITSDAVEAAQLRRMASVVLAHELPHDVHGASPSVGDGSCQRFTVTHGVLGIGVVREARHEPLLSLAGDIPGHQARGVRSRRPGAASRPGYRAPP